MLRNRSLFVLALLAACTSPVAPTVSGTISGKVTVEAGDFSGVVVAIPSGATAPASDGTFRFDSAPVGTYVVTATKDGYASSIAPVTVGAAGKVDVALTLSRTAALTLESFTIGKAVLARGEEATLTAQISGKAGDTFTYQFTSDDAAWTVTPGTAGAATVKAPDASEAATVLRVTVTNSRGESVRGALQASTLANGVPVLASVVAEPSAVAPGGSVTLRANATDPEGDELGFLWTPPEGWTIASSEGAFVVLTAPAEYGRSDTASVLVNDGHGGTASGSVVIATRADAAPVLTTLTATPASVPRGGTVTAQIVATDPDGDVLTYTWTPPDGWTLAGEGSQVTLTAPATYAGAGLLRVDVSDGLLTRTAQATLAVNAARPPVLAGLVSSPQSSAPGGSIALSATAVSLDGNPLTYTWGAPAGWVVNGSGPSVSLIAPTAYAASGLVTLTVSDGFGTASGSIAVATLPNHAPTIAGLLASPPATAPSGSLSLQVTAADPDGDQLTYDWTAPAGWFVVGTGATVTLRAPAVEGSSGVVTATVSDGFGGAAAASVAVATTTNGAPTVVSLVATPSSVVRGGALVAQVLATDPEDDTLTYSWTAPAGWAVSGTGANVTVTAPSTYAGAGFLQVVISDGRLTRTAQTSIEVQAEQAPVLTSVVATPSLVVPGGTVSLKALAGSPDGNPLTYTWTAPAGWTLTGTGANVTLNAPLELDRSGLVTVEISDGFSTVTGAVTVATQATDGLQIVSLTAVPAVVARGGVGAANVVTTAGNGPLTYTWTAPSGWSVVGQGAGVTLRAPTTNVEPGILQVAVSDGLVTRTAQTLLSVQANRSPVLSGVVASPAVVVPGATTLITAYAADADGDSLVYSWSAPAGWTVIGAGANALVTAPAGYAQSAPVTVSVSDAFGGVTTGAVTVATAANTAPRLASLVALPATAAPGGTVTLSASASDEDGDLLSYAWTAPQGWTLDGTGASVTLTAPSAHGQSGLATVVVSDGTDNVSASVVVSTNTNSAPVVASVTAAPSEVSPGGATAITARATDADGDSLTYAWAAPAGWTVAGTGASVVLTAPATYGLSGLVTVTVSDGSSSVRASVAVSTRANRAPAISALSASPAQVAAGGTIAVVASAADPDGDQLTYTWSTSSGWALSGSGASVIVTAPSTAGASGLVTVTVSDGLSTVSMTTAVGTTANSAPVISSLVLAPTQATPGGTITASVIATDPDGDALTYAWVVPAGWTGSSTSAAITLTAPTSGNTTPLLKVTVSDGTRTTSASTALTVQYPAPTATLTASTLAPLPGATVTLTAAAYDPWGASLTYSWLSSNAGWTVTPTGSTATIKAPFANGTSTVVTVFVSNGTSTTAQSISLTATSCAGTTMNCDGSSATCEADLSSSATNCGACGVTCGISQTCTLGACGCTVGQSICSGLCTSTQTDNNNCGSCGFVCGVGTTCSQGVCGTGFLFSGTRTDLTYSAMVAAGWRQCFSGTYAGTPTVASVQAACTSTNLLVACRAVSTDALIVAAEAPRTDVLFDVGTGATSVHTANGTDWYFSASSSWGFAGQGVGVNRNSCDTNTTSPGTRLCWHTSGGNFTGGYRCGATTSLNSSTAYERLVFQYP